MKHTKNKISHKLIGLAFSLLSYFIFLLSTNPAKLPLGLILVPSFLLGAVVYYLVRSIQSLLGFKDSIATSLAWSFLAVLLSMLASLGQLSWRDITLSFVLVGVFIFYFERSKN